MGIAFDSDYWTKRYESDYPIDTNGVYPKYIDENGVEREEKSPYFETMSKTLVARGFLLKKEFVSIGRWKTPRQINNYEANSEETVGKITSQVLKEKSETKQIRLLTKGALRGVKIPVASAILTVVYPKEYCIIDYRASRALRWLQRGSKNQLTFNSYREYSDFLDSLDDYTSLKGYLRFLNQLRSITVKHNGTPRQLEMALWKFDQMKGMKQEK
jgi:hypothetical protein